MGALVVAGGGPREGGGKALAVVGSGGGAHRWVSGGLARQQSGKQRGAPDHCGGKRRPLVQRALWYEKYGIS